MSKKAWLITLVVILALALTALIAYLVMQNRSLKSKLNEETAAVTATASPTATKTATKVATKTPVKSPTPSVAAKSDEELIAEALGRRLSQDPSNLDITISKKSDKAAFGGVTVKGESSGGWFVAVEDGDQWKVIADGNGTIECAILDEYSVPASVVEECYDSATGQTRTR